MKKTVLFFAVFSMMFFAACSFDKFERPDADNESSDEDAADDASDETADETVDGTADDMTDEAADESSDEAVDEAVDESSDETGDDIPDEVSDDVNDETADDNPDETADEASDETADEMPDDFVPYTEYDFSDLYYVSQMSSDKECCFDLDGDSTIDNQIGSVFDSLDDLSGTSYSQMIQNAIEAGEICSVYETLSGTMPFFDCFDEDIDYSDNVDGDESFILWVENFIKYGSEYSAYPLDVYITATTDKIRGTADIINDFPVILLSARPSVVNLTNAMIEIDLDGSSVPVSGVVGGVILMEDLAKGMNDSISHCTCLSYPVSGLFYIDTNKKLKCDLTSNDCDSEDEAEAECNNTGQFCNIYGSMFTPDIDADGDAVKDAISVGYKFDLVTAGAPQVHVFTDTDGDGIDDLIDNCPETSNSDQKNGDGDGFGDVCDCDPDNAVEICDGKDNDCDDLTDEDFASLGSSCGTGACNGGIVQCSMDMLSTVCSTEAGGSDDQSGPEVCDGTDNDCDGTADEDDGEDPICPEGTECQGNNGCVGG